MKAVMQQLVGEGEGGWRGNTEHRHEGWTRLMGKEGQLAGIIQWGGWCQETWGWPASLWTLDCNLLENRTWVLPESASLICTQWSRLHELKEPSPRIIHKTLSFFYYYYFVGSLPSLTPFLNIMFCSFCIKKTHHGFSTLEKELEVIFIRDTIYLCLGIHVASLIPLVTNGEMHWRGAPGICRTSQQGCRKVTRVVHILEFVYLQSTRTQAIMDNQEWTLIFMPSLSSASSASFPWTHNNIYEL